MINTGIQRLAELCQLEFGVPKQIDNKIDPKMI
jgi:hypothetical protein